MKFAKTLITGLALAICGTAGAADIAWFTPSQARNSNTTFTVSSAYTTNFGVAFLSGSTTNKMDWVSLGLNTSSQTSGGGSFRLSLRNTNNSTAYSAVAGSTELAGDNVTFTSTTNTNTDFTLTLRAADIPNITNYTMAASTAYSLIIYNASAAYGLQRTTGYANGTTNSFYTVSNGFTALDTFRNNTANYTNTTNSYPTLFFSFGQTTQVPEPSTYALGAIATGVMGFVARRRKAKQV